MTIFLISWVMLLIAESRITAPEQIGGRVGNVRATGV